MSFIISLFSNIVNYGKIIGGAVLGLLALFGWYKYNSKVEKIDELKDYVEQKDKIIEAQDKQAIVQNKVNEQVVDNITLEKDTALNDIEVNSKLDKKNIKAQKKVEKTPDGVTYEINV